MKHNWEKVKIGSIAIQQKRITKVDAKSTYNLIGIRSNNEGVFFRETKSGNDILSDNLLKVSEGDFIYSRLSAPSGGFGVINDEFDNSYVSNEFPVFEIDKNKSTSEFLFYYFSQKSVLHQLQSKGTGRTRFSEAEFFNQEIPLPPLIVQQKILSTLEKIKSKTDEIINLRAEQVKDINNLLFSKYTDIIENAEWLPMKDVAPINRRQVEVNPEETYFEIGVRSFGRGLFENPSFKGSDLTWQKPFWMREGDLLFSNIKAWEGAVGLIPKKYDGWVGSHRYITCLPNLKIIAPEFLYYYFRTFEGVEKLSSASPGTVDRNRTLNNKLLQQIEIPVPPIELQREFVELLNKTNGIKEYHKQTEQELSELMPSLLDKAFKGELFNDTSMPVKKGISLPTQQKETQLPLAASNKNDDLELAMIVALIESRLGNSYGEVGIQKTVFNIEAFNPALSKKYSFVNYHYGTYSAELKECLKINPFLGKKTIRGNEVFNILSTNRKTVLDAISDKANSNFVLSVNNVLNLYTSPIIGRHTDKIELLNTVTKLVMDLQTSDVAKIYEGMKTWKIKQVDFKSKADKFNINYTKKIIQLLKTNNLIERLINPKNE